MHTTPPSPARRLSRLLVVASSVVAAFVLSPSIASASQTAGVQAHLLWSGVTEAQVDDQLERAKAAGAGLVRVDVGWASLETSGKGRYEAWYLAKIDSLVAKAEGRGLKILFTVWETPCWASSAPDEAKQGCAGAWWDRGVQRYGPRDPADYADALAFLVRRYGNRVSAWEVWNEPNLPEFFKSSDPIAEYARIVKAAYPAAKQADSSAKIIAGSLADADFAFTEGLYQQGIKGYFDAYSVHPYSGGRSPLDPFEDRWRRHSFVRGVPAVRETMVRHDDAKPLWLTEIGYSTCTVRGQETWANCVDEDTQAKHLREAYTQMRQWAYVEVGVWYNLRDKRVDDADRNSNYGLLKYDGSERPAYEAFRKAATELAESSVPAPSPPVASTPSSPEPARSAPAPSVASGPSQPSPVTEEPPSVPAPQSSSTGTEPGSPETSRPAPRRAAPPTCLSRLRRTSGTAYRPRRFSKRRTAVCVRRRSTRAQGRTARARSRAAPERTIVAASATAGPGSRGSSAPKSRTPR